MNIEITTNQTGSLDVFSPMYQQETLTSANADTWAKGTVLGRITTSAKLTIYTSGASDGSETPVAVLADEVVFTAAGDKSDQVIIGGRLRLEDLVADGVGDITKAEQDALRSYGIIAISTKQLSKLDNQ